MSVLRKSVPVEVKAIDDEKGIVEAIVSVFGNIDLGGDRVVKGAFAKSLLRWSEKGAPIPVVWSHQWDDLWSHIGYVDPKDVEETEQGLKARYTLDIHDNPAAAQAYKLLKRGAVREHSFAYTTVHSKRGQGGANDLTELDLIEIGPTLKGMNPETEVLAVKSALEAVTAAHEPEGDAPSQDVQVKAGRTLSKANEAKLRAAMDSLAQVLSSLGASEGETPEKSLDEDEATGKAVDPAEATGKSSDLEHLSVQQAIDKMREWNNDAVR